MVAQQTQHEVLPWKEDSLWGRMTEEAGVLDPFLTTEAEQAAAALLAMTPQDSMNALLDDIPCAWEIRLLRTKSPSHLERELGAIGSAIRREIIARRGEDDTAMAIVRLLPEEQAFITKLMAAKGYTTEWGAPPAARLLHHTDHNDGRSDLMVMVRMEEVPQPDGDSAA